MKFLKKKPEHIGYLHFGEKAVPEYRCPTCGMGVVEEYCCCPYCGQRLGEFKENICVQYITLQEKEEKRFIEKNIGRDKQWRD